jgi:CzcA family heavy metal efflux pump
MMSRVIMTSMKIRLVVASMAALLIIFGYMQLSKVPVDVLPEFSRPFVEIQTEALGLSAPEVEALITTPLEADLLNGISWVEEIRSESLPGLCHNVLIFEKGTDIMKARQMVQERLIGIHALPNVSTPPMMLNPISSSGRILQVGLSSDELSLIDISVLARWTMVPRLMGVPGVANVSIWGQRKRQLQVQVDPEVLKEKGVTLHQIISTTGNALWVSPLSYLAASTPGTGGWIDTPNQRLGIRHVSPISTPEQLAHVTVEGTKMLLGDVSKVVEEHQPLIGDAIIDDSPSLMLIVEKFPWANTVDVTKGVENTLDEMKPGLSGLKIDPTLFKPATFIEVATSNLGSALTIGGILVLIALFAFSLNWRSTLISAVVILVSMIVGIAVLYVRGIMPNMMIIAGLMVAMGLIIDDAIVDVENIRKRIQEHFKKGDDKSIATVIYEASMEMRGPLFYATIILALVAVPLFALEGLSGSLYQPLALSYLMALLASFVVALIVTPALSLIFLKKSSAKSGDSPVAQSLRKMYDGLFMWATRSPWAAFVTVCLFLVIGIASSFFFTEGSVVPTFKENDLLVRWDAPEGTSHQEMNRISALVSRELRQIPGVNNVSANVGRAVYSDRINEMNSAQLWVSVDPSADYEATMSEVANVIQGYPGISNEVLTYLQSRVREELSGTAHPLVVRVYGEDHKIIRAKAEEIQMLLAHKEGIVDAIVQYPNEHPTLEIEVDLERAKRYGVKPGDVRREASTLLGGIRVGSLFEEQKVFDVLVWGNPDSRHSISGINNLLISTPNGDHVQLKDVADIRIVNSVTRIDREAISRYIDVTASISNGNYTNMVASIQNDIGNMNFPLEYRAEVLGEYAEQLAARDKMRSFFIAAIILIFLLLQAISRSWKLATAIFLTIPMAVVGGLLMSLFAFGSALSLGSVLGLTAVLILAVRNSVILIRKYQSSEMENNQSVDPGIVKSVTRERVVPIVSSAIVLMVGALPMAFSGNIAGLEIFHTMALVIIGGLITSTLYSLIGVPAMYLMFASEQEPELEFTPDTLAAEGRSV